MTAGGFFRPVPSAGVLPAGWQLNLGTLQILMPRVIPLGLGFSWLLLQSRGQSVVEWLPARLFLLILGLFLHRLL